MEARLGAVIQSGGLAVAEVPPVAAPEETVEAVIAGEGAPNAWPDETAEASMLSELRERGEQPVAAPASEPAEETETKNLPSLDELVKRLPADVRETLDDLFRARFVRVARVPQKALKK